MSSAAFTDRESFWHSLISRRETLRLTVAQLCEQAGVSPASFFHWQRKLRTAGLRPVRGSKPAARPLVPVRIVEDRVAEITLELPNGIRLRIPPGCDAATLQQVLRVALSAAREQQPC
jgi:AcrR family transcriptional regulator